MDNRFFRFFLWLLFLIFEISSAGLASGIFVELDSSAPWHITQRSEHVFKSDAESQEGDFTISRTFLGLKKECKCKNGLPIDFSFSLGHYYVKDGTAVDLPSSLQSKGMGLGTKMPMPFVGGDPFFIGLDLGGYFQSAKEHDFDSRSFRVKSRLYGIYKSNDKFVFVAGTMWRPGYEDQAVMPFAGLKYIMNDHWSFHFLSDEPSINYKFNEQMTIKCQFRWYRDEFEVVSGGRKGDIVKISEMHTGLGLDYDINDDISVQSDIGWAFARKYEYLKNGGKVVPEGSLFFGAKLNIKF